MGIKSQELKPTKDNLIKTLKNDTIGRNAALKKFIYLCNLLEEGYSIAIDGEWGDGKTFFVKQAQLVIESCNSHLESNLTKEERDTVLAAINMEDDSPENETPQVCVYYDAWLNDNDNDPLLSLVCEITKSVAVDFSKVDNATMFQKAIAIIDAFGKTSINNTIEKLTGEDPLEEIKRQKTIDVMVSEFLESLLPERGNRLIVIIDELDRCKPTFAIQLLERIKHYFSDDHITFVFSINLSELLHSVKRYYGNGFDAVRYLDRFFDIRIPLPPVDMDRYYCSIGVTDSVHYFDLMCKLVATQYQFKMREAVKYFGYIKITANKIAHSRGNWGFNEGRGTEFGFMVFTPIIIGLWMTDNKKYYDFINGDDPEPLIDLLVRYARASRMCELLLDGEETYEESPSKEKINVKLEDKLLLVYKSIFSNNGQTVTVGKCAFTDRTKGQILKATNALSEYASFDDR